MLKKISLALLLLASCTAETPKYAGPNCLGLFCVDRRTSAHKLFKRLGQPMGKSSPYCYASPQEDTFLYVKTGDGSDPDLAVEVFISDFPNCLHMPRRVTADDLRAWKTPAGIGLGSLEENILKTYGKPSNKRRVDLTNARTTSHMISGYRPGDPIPKGADKAIFYTGDVSEDLRIVEFGIRNGKVSWIWLSMDE
ncbi:MAG TPA: hypothetical protein VKU42_02095 [Candidatus Angelobacter sp.]|nr:hypothetical protein [Candidatus Angelobacter sp.]